MNDFSELESELKKLRPALPSPVLFQRVQQALDSCSASVSGVRWKPWRPTETSSKWWSLGFGLAAAAVLILFAVVTMERHHERQETVAQNSPVAAEQPAPRGMAQSMSPGQFVSAGGTDLIYNAHDEGLHFADGSERPVRRLRYQTQQTWRWRNPKTGASLRVSYPSEEIVLIPVSVQ
jgi:hypothetical protein